MDFLHRNANNQPQAVKPSGTSTSPTSGANNSLKKSDRHQPPRWLRVAFVTLLFSGTILAIAIAGLLYVGKDKEAQYVNKDKYQAVFLTNGQVYFGKVAKVTSEYVNLQGIYYLNSQQGTAEGDKKTEQTSFSLVKLGCELHGPADQMIINRDQVSFWENLTSEGKVAKAIDQFISENPEGQTCSDSTQQNSTQQSTGGSTTTPVPSTNKQQ